MDAIFELCLQVTLWLQSIGDWIYSPMETISFLGTEEFYLFIAPIIFWCVDVKLGLRLGLSLMITTSINSVLKLLFHSPRPFWYDTRVHTPSPETSFGIPSGHSQDAVMVWGILAHWINRSWAWIAAIFIIFLIGFSRIVLGVHFLVDVLVGWTIGALIFWAVIKWEKPIIKWLGGFQLYQQVLWVFLASIFMIGLGYAVQNIHASWIIPQDWITNAKLVIPVDMDFNPKDLSGLITSTGAFFGIAAGGIWLQSHGSYDATGPFLQRLLRFLIGLVGIYLIWGGLGSLLPRGEEWFPLVLRYLRYTLVGLWISVFAPLLFIKMGLAEPLNKSSWK
jgi:membrane-associated phospholipid phosphatase